MKTIATIGALLAGACPLVCAGQTGNASTVYKALKCPTPSLSSTWAILDRNGANQKVDKYLSSLASG